MSVMNFDQAEWQKLFNTLVNKATHTTDWQRINPIDANIYRQTAKLYYNGDEEEAIIGELVRFVKQLYYANELCLAYQYDLEKGQPATIQPFPVEHWVFQPQYNLVELNDFLDSINYNCFSNGGTDFMPGPARQVFNDLKLLILRKLTNQIKEKSNPVAGYSNID